MSAHDDRLIDRHEEVQQAVSHLRAAADILRRAGATRAHAKARRALKSAEGAERHAYGRIVRAKTGEV